MRFQRLASFPQHPELQRGGALPPRWRRHRRTQFLPYGAPPLVLLLKKMKLVQRRALEKVSYRQSKHRGSPPTAHGGSELDADIGEKVVVLRSLIPHVEAPVILVAPRRVAKTPRRLRNDGGQAIQRRRHSLSLESPFSVWITAAQGLSAQADEEGRREQGSSPIYPP